MQMLELISIFTRGPIDIIQSPFPRLANNCDKIRKRKIDDNQFIATQIMS